MNEHDYANELAGLIEQGQFGAEADGLHFGPTDLTIVLKALRALTATIVPVTAPAEPEPA